MNIQNEFDSPYLPTLDGYDVVVVCDYWRDTVYVDEVPRNQRFLPDAPVHSWTLDRYTQVDTEALAQVLADLAPQFRALIDHCDDDGWDASDTCEIVERTLENIPGKDIWPAENWFEPCPDGELLGEISAGGYANLRSYAANQVEQAAADGVIVTDPLAYLSGRLDLDPDDTVVAIDGGYAKADLSQSAAPIRVCDPNDLDELTWQSTPFQVADCGHQPSQMIWLFAEENVS